MNSNLAFVFPGQGSQKIGMLGDLAAENVLVEETFAQASAVLGYDCWQLVQQGEQEDINLTERTQPILLTASVAIWRLWQHLGGPTPGALAGHSLGEWSALVCAGAVDFADAVNIVRSRGAFMQQAVPVGVGAMAAIMGIDDDIVVDACRQAAQQQIVAAVNFNAPGQVVIAGDADAVARAVAICKKAGAKRAVELPVSAPFHTSLMRPAADNLAQLIEQTNFSAPQIPVIHNVHAQAEDKPQAIKSLMLEQIYKPVLWVDCVNGLAARGAEILIECGPGRVLNGLSKRIDRNLTSLATDDVASLENALSSV
ncbi:ACP S-malonyltransferase [Porticoccaceae bacterium]|nr:ACP S-malonyltransferase [Porticoccaceae bacterium]